MLSTGAWAQTSLQEQINNATGATTIQLSQNVDLGATTLIIPADKDITLDLNGHSITSSASGAVAVKNNGSLTVKDTSGEKAGKIISTKYAGIGAGDNSTTTFESGNIESVEGAIITGKAVGATISINGGTFSATDNAVIMGNGSARDGNANTIIINGGTFNSQIISAGYVACGIYAPWKDVITVNGGTFNITNGCGICARAGSVTINGGEFNCTGTATGKVGDSRVVVPCSAIVYDTEAGYPAMTTESKIEVPSTSTAKFTAASGVAAVSVVGESHIEISGGSYSSPLTEDVCAEGYIPSNTPNADGTYGAKEGSYVAQVGEKKYETLAAAVADATEGQTVTLLADINEAVKNINNNNFTIDLNSKNWTGTDAFTNNGGTVTFTGEGTVKATAEDGVAVWARTGSIIINGGNYENCSNEEATVYVGTKNEILGGKKPSVTINGGSFKNTAEGVYKWNTNLLPLTLNVHNDISNADTYQAIVIKGGTFYGNDPSIGDDAQLEKINNNSNFVSSELHAEMKDGVFVIEEGGYIAQVGYLKYLSLDEAITTAIAEQTITLFADATATEELPANVTIDADGKALTLPTFTVTDGSAISYANVENATDNTYKVTNATYNRTGAVGTQWGTVCLPFSFESAPTGYTLYTPTTVDDNVLTVTEVTYPVAAGTPVIFHKSSAAETTMTMTSLDASVKIGASPLDQAGTLALVGTFSQQEITSGLTSIYFINGDKFHQAKASLTVPAYRAYIKNTSAGAKASILNILIGGETTGLESISMKNESAAAIYDANGIRLSAPQKGLNIMKLANGKTVKLIVK